MTKLLEKAISEAEKLSEQEQDALATWILKELESDHRWMKAFTESKDTLAQLAEEALTEYHKGCTEELDPDKT